MDELDPELVPDVRDELCRLIGLRLLKTLPIFAICGWDSIDGARTYLHGGPLDAELFLDFIDWSRGVRKDEARERLMRTAEMLGLGPKDVMTATGRRLMDPDS